MVFPYRCANCTIALKSHRIGAKSVLGLNRTLYDVLAVWIHPIELSADLKICQECYNLLRCQARQEVPARDYAHRAICLGCGVSVLKTRGVIVDRSKPEYLIIQSWVPQIQPDLPIFNKYCISCWRKATREQGLSTLDVEQDEQETDNDDVETGKMSEKWQLIQKQSDEEVDPQFWIDLTEAYLSCDMLYKKEKDPRPSLKAERRSAYMYISSRLQLDAAPKHMQLLIWRYKDYLKRILTSLRSVVGSVTSESLQQAPDWVRRAAIALHMRDNESDRGTRKPAPDPKLVACTVIDELLSRAQRARALTGACVVAPLGSLTGDVVERAWDRLQHIVMQKLKYLISIGDHVVYSDDNLQLSPRDWDLANMVLLYSEQEYILVTDDTWSINEQRNALCLLHFLVQHYDAERRCTHDAWSRLHCMYLKHRSYVSLVLLQRRWFEIKLHCRTRALHHPQLLTELQATILDKYPHIVTEPLMSWKEMIDRGMIHSQNVQDEDLTLTDEQLEPEPAADDDLILIEKEIETVEVNDDDDDSRLVITEATPPSGVTVKTEPKLDENDPEYFRIKVKEKTKAVCEKLAEELNKQLQELDDDLNKNDEDNKIIDDSKIAGIDALESFDPDNVETTLIFDSDSDEQTDNNSEVNKDNNRELNKRLTKDIVSKENTNLVAEDCDSDTDNPKLVIDEGKTDKQIATTTESDKIVTDTELGKTDTEIVTKDANLEEIAKTASDANLVAEDPQLGSNNTGLGPKDTQLGPDKDKPATEPEDSQLRSTNAEPDLKEPQLALNNLELGVKEPQLGSNNAEDAKTTQLEIKDPQLVSNNTESDIKDPRLGFNDTPTTKTEDSQLNDTEIGTKYPKLDPENVRLVTEDSKLGLENIKLDPKDIKSESNIPEIKITNIDTTNPSIIIKKDDITIEETQLDMSIGGNLSIEVVLENNMIPRSLTAENFKKLMRIENKDEEVIDQKLLMRTSIQLIKIDSTKFWKKYNKNNTININHIDNTELIINNKSRVYFRKHGRVSKRSQSAAYKSMYGMEEKEDFGDMTRDGVLRSAKEDGEDNDTLEVSSDEDDMPLLVIRENKSRDLTSVMNLNELKVILQEAKKKNAMKSSGQKRQFCCVARRHRVINDARRRMSHRAGKPFSYSIIHEHNKNDDKEKCECCCRHLLERSDVELSRDLRRDLRNLNKLIYTGRIEDNSNKIKKPRPTQSKSKKRTNQKSCIKPKKKKKPSVEEPTNYKPSDEEPSNYKEGYTEWVRQKNLNAQLFGDHKVIAKKQPRVEHQPKIVVPNPTVIQPKPVVTPSRPVIQVKPHISKPPINLPKQSSITLPDPQVATVKPRIVQITPHMVSKPNSKPTVQIVESMGTTMVPQPTFLGYNTFDKSKKQIATVKSQTNSNVPQAAVIPSTSVTTPQVTLVTPQVTQTTPHFVQHTIKSEPTSAQESPFTIIPSTSIDSSQVTQVTQATPQVTQTTPIYQSTKIKSETTLPQIAIVEGTILTTQTTPQNIQDTPQVIQETVPIIQVTPQISQDRLQAASQATSHLVHSPQIQTESTPDGPKIVLTTSLAQTPQKRENITENVSKIPRKKRKVPTQTETLIIDDDSESNDDTLIIDDDSAPNVNVNDPKRLSTVTVYKAVNSEDKVKDATSLLKRNRGLKTEPKKGVGSDKTGVKTGPQPVALIQYKGAKKPPPLRGKLIPVKIINNIPMNTKNVPPTVKIAPKPGPVPRSIEIEPTEATDGQASLTPVAHIKIQHYTDPKPLPCVFLPQCASVDVRGFLSGKDPTALHLLCADSRRPLLLLAGHYALLTSEPVDQTIRAAEYYTMNGISSWYRVNLGKSCQGDGEGASAGPTRSGAFTVGPVPGPIRAMYVNERVSFLRKVYRKLNSEPLIFAQVHTAIGPEHWRSTCELGSVELWDIRSGNIYPIARYNNAGLHCEHNEPLTELVSLLNSKSDLTYATLTGTALPRRDCDVTPTPPSPSAPSDLATLRPLQKAQSDVIEIDSDDD